MPYTKDNAPDWVKGLPGEAQGAWIKAFNAALKQYGGDEGKAASVASATIKKMGYKKVGDKWVKAKEHALEFALGELSVFGAEAKPEVVLVAEDCATVAVNDKTYSVPFVEKGGAFVFGKAAEAEPEMQTFELAKESERIAFAVAEDAAHRADPDNGDWPVVIIEAGHNKTKRREYTDLALESADPESYVGRPMHLDHNGKEGNQSVRSVTEMASVIKAAWHGVSEAGKQQIRGLAHVFDPWLKERLKDADFRKLVGLSHVADIAGRVRGVGKAATQVVESIVQPYAVDWVSAAAFGGRVTESEDVISQRSEDLMALETLTAADLERDRPELMESIRAEAVKTFKASASESEAVSDAEQKARDAEARAAEAEAKLRDVQVRQTAAEEVAKPDYKIPDAARLKVVDRVADRLKGADIPADKMSATVAETVKAEVDFGASLTVARTEVKAPKGDSNGGSADTRTKLQAACDRMFGVKSDKNES